MSASRRGEILSDIILIAAVTGLLVSGCSKPQTAGGGATLAAGRWLDGRPGQDLAKTKTYMTSTIKFGSKSPQDSAFVGNYPCKPEPGCTQDSISLTVVPEKKAYEINWDEAMRNGKKGAIVAKLVNDNNIPYPPLQLAPHDSAYMWVGPVNDDGTQSAVAYYKFNFSTWEITGPLKQTQVITYCDMPNWQSRTHSAAKKDYQHSGANCRTSNPVPATNSMAVKAPPLFINVSFKSTMFAPSGGTWISCMYGCCDVGYPN